jgi:hypothetical protein
VLFRKCYQGDQIKRVVMDGERRKNVRDETSVQQSFSENLKKKGPLEELGYIGG